MPISLRIDNFDQLPDGGPVEFTAGPRGFDIGRGQHLDWCLPDETRFISTNHCEVRFENGGYWLRDVSKNGTFLNGGEGRMQSPYRLQNGDRLKIGHYVVNVTITGAGEPAQPVYQEPRRQEAFAAPGEDLWAVGDSAAPKPVDRRWFADQQRSGQRAPDVLEHFIDLPSARQPESPFGGQSWQQAPQAPYPQQPAGTQWPAQVGGPGQMPTGQPPSPFPPASPFPPGPTQFPHSGQTQFPQGGAPQYPPAGYPPPGGPPPGAFGQPAQPVRPMPGGYQAPAAAGFAGGGDMPASAFIAAIASAAGISPQALAGRAPDDVAAEIGAILRTVTEGLMALLKARAVAKLMAKSSNRTMITAQNNNPLKFVPDVREAMEMMFSRNKSGYLSAAASYKEGLENIKSHEVATYAAMQKALARLMDDLTPEAVEDKVGSSGFGNKKARAWDLYVERWNAKTEPYENGVLDLFLAYFAEAYDASQKN